MTSKNLVIAAVVVVIVAVAAVAILATGSDDPDHDSDPIGLKKVPSVNDEYTIAENGGTLGSAGDETTYAVNSVNGEKLEVCITTRFADGTSHTEIRTMTVDEYYQNIYYYLDTEDRGQVTKITTPFGEKSVYIVRDNDNSGATSFSTVDYVGVGSYIVYRSEITITSIGVTETIVRELVSSSVTTDDPSEIITPVPEDPRPSETINVGDTIEWLVVDDDNERNTVKYTVIEIRNGMVTYSETDSDDPGDVDIEHMAMSSFVKLIWFQPNDRMQKAGSETITIDSFGSVECDVYSNGNHGDRFLVYVGKTDGVIYRTVEYDDNRIDETTTLIGINVSGGSDTPAPVEPDDYEIKLAVGDHYTIEELDDGIREVTEYRVIAISGNRLTVQEIENGRHTIESESVRGFLDDVFISTSDLIGAVRSPGGTYLNMDYSVYTFTESDGDIEEYWISDDYNMILKKTSIDGLDEEIETLLGFSFASLNF